MLQKLKGMKIPKPDFVGISASFLCMVHCLAYPLIISLGLLVKGPESSPRHFGAKYQHVHLGWYWLDYVFVTLAIWAVVNAAKNTHSDFIKIGLWLSVTVFSFAILLHHRVEWMFFVSLTASLSLLIFHILNLKNYKIANYHNK
jgi:hypothetical protein